MTGTRLPLPSKDCSLVADSRYPGRGFAAARSNLAGARSDQLCAVGRGTYPLMAHRVSRVTTVAG